jgi:type II secretion system protein J
MGRLNELAAAFALMKSDLANSSVPLSPQDRAASGFLSLIGQDGAEQFSFVRLLPDDADMGRQRIGYRCGVESLSRLVWQDENNPADLPKESTLLSGLRSCTFKYLNAGGQWLNGWQPQPGNLAPRAVELNISEADGTPIRRVMGVQ